MSSRRWLVLALGAACAASRPPESPPPLPAGIVREIREARVRHAVALEPFGHWEDDARCVVRWCPHEPPPGESPFQAFRNYGRWVATRGGATWATARPGTWLETTTRKGWWIYRQASDEWCWVPGDLDAHVAWRTGLAYVGWAPYTPKGELEDIPDRAWTYTMLGVLYDEWLTILSGEARTDAMAATRPESGRSAPTTEEVAAARAELLERAKNAGMASGRDLPPAQSLWALVTGNAPTTVGGAASPPAASASGSPFGGIPGMEGMGALKKLLGDGGLPPGLLPGLDPH